LPPLIFAAGGALPMPHARIIGTAWDKTLDDYAYMQELDLPGIAWEFLRRHEALRRDARISCAGKPKPIKHVSGANYLRCYRRFPLAERWHLQFFPDPHRKSFDTEVFWLPKTVTKHVSVRLGPAEVPHNICLSLEDFSCQRTVLCAGEIEHMIVKHGPESVRLSARGLSILHGQRQALFEVQGYVDTAESFAAIQSLESLAGKSSHYDDRLSDTRTKWRDYLIALDGHLAGRSYRDIAEVTYGSHRVGHTWSHDTQSLKDRVRRAVGRGLQLMNGGYVDLL
jgi:hypothetical protein